MGKGKEDKVCNIVEVVLVLSLAVLTAKTERKCKLRVTHVVSRPENPNPSVEIKKDRVCDPWDHFLFTWLTHPFETRKEMRMFGKRVCKKGNRREDWQTHLEREIERLTCRLSGDLLRSTLQSLYFSRRRQVIRNGHFRMSLSFSQPIINGCNKWKLQKYKVYDFGTLMRKERVKEKSKEKIRICCHEMEASTRQGEQGLFNINFEKKD